MSYIVTSPLIEFKGEWWEINTHPSGIYHDMMQTILGQLFAALSHHNKALIFRFDLHHPSYTDTNKIITDFLRRLSRRVMRHYGLTRFGYCWAREQEKAKQQHYHFALILDGNKIQKPSLIWEIVKTIWEFMGGTCWLPENPYYRLIRANRYQTQEAIKRLSYLAKGRGKGYKPHQTKNYGASRTKPREASKP